jgi:hypothetical protein
MTISTPSTAPAVDGLGDRVGLVMIHPPRL